MVRLQTEKIMFHWSLNQALYISGDCRIKQSRHVTWQKHGIIGLNKIWKVTVCPARGLEQTEYENQAGNWLTAIPGSSGDLQLNDVCVCVHLYFASIIQYSGWNLPLKQCVCVSVCIFLPLYSMLKVNKRKLLLLLLLLVYLGTNRLQGWPTFS